MPGVNGRDGWDGEDGPQGPRGDPGASGTVGTPGGPGKEGGTGGGGPAGNPATGQPVTEMVLNVPRSDDYDWKSIWAKIPKKPKNPHVHRYFVGEDLGIPVTRTVRTSEVSLYWKKMQDCAQTIVGWGGEPMIQVSPIGTRG